MTDPASIEPTKEEVICLNTDCRKECSFFHHKFHCCGFVLCMQCGDNCQSAGRTTCPACGEPWPKKLAEPSESAMAAAQYIRDMMTPIDAGGCALDDEDQSVWIDWNIEDVARTLQDYGDKRIEAVDALRLAQITAYQERIAILAVKVQYYESVVWCDTSKVYRLQDGGHANTMPSGKVTELLDRIAVLEGALDDFDVLPAVNKTLTFDLATHAMVYRQGNDAMRELMQKRVCAVAERVRDGMKATLKQGDDSTAQEKGPAEEGDGGT